MQFTFTKNTQGGVEGLGFGTSPQRKQSRRSISKMIDPTPRSKVHINIGSPNIKPDHEETPEDTGWLSTQRTQKFINEPLIEIKEMLESKEEGQLYSLEDGRQTKLEFQKLQVIESSTTLTAFVGTYLTVLVYDLQFDETENDLTHILLWTLFASTLICILLNIMRYLQKLKFLKARNRILQSATLVSTGDIWYLLGETFVLLLQPYAFFCEIQINGYDNLFGSEYYYNLNDFFSLLIVTRFYLLSRFILNRLIYRSPRSQRIGDMYGSESNYLYTCRSAMRIDPIKTAVLLFGGSILIFGYMIRVCERPLSRNSDNPMEFNTYWNCMWCVILTMTTVGYGDIYARTFLGRVISLIVCIWGTFVVSIMVITLTNILQMNNCEEKSLMVLQRLELRKKLENEAAYVVTNMAKIGVIQKKEKDVKKKQKAIKGTINSLKLHLSQFKSVSRQIKGLDDNNGFGEEVNRQLMFLREDVKTAIEKHMELKNNIHKMISEAGPPMTIHSLMNTKDDFEGEGIFIQKAR